MIEKLASIKSPPLAPQITAEPQAAKAAQTPTQIKVINKVPRAFLDVIEAQFNIMQDWMKPLLKLTDDHSADAQHLKKAIDDTYSRYEKLLQRMEEAARKATM